MNDLLIRKTDDYEKLVKIFIKNGLEFSEDEPVVITEIVQCWEVMESDKLIGGCVLALRQGEYIIDGIAIEPEFQSTGIGSKLLNTVIDFLKSIKATQLYLVARAPDFFKKQGFEEIIREEAPNFFECFGCDQYKKTCFPEVMLLKI